MEAKLEKPKKFADEFKEFITKGNVMDMAVGVIIGGAFQKIISSLVEKEFQILQIERIYQQQLRD